MNWLNFLIGISWIGFWVYWISAAIHSGVTQLVTHNRRLRLAYLIISTVAFLSLSKYLALGQITFPHRPIVKALGVVLIYGGMALAIWARRVMGNAWGLPMTVQTHPKLITRGPYGLIRHPIYSGLILAALGTGLALTRVWLYIFAVFLIFSFYSARSEEKMLAKSMPKE